MGHSPYVRTGHSHTLALVAFAIPMLMVLATRLPTLWLSMLGWDESVYALVARQWLQGYWGFERAWDHKPVAIFYHFATVIALFGDTPAVTRAIGVVAVAVSVCLLFVVAHRRVGLSLPISSSLAIAYAWLSTVFEGHGTNSEIMVNAYLWLWIYAASGSRSRGSWIVAGIAAGTAVQINYLAGLVLAGLYVGMALFRGSPIGWLVRSGLFAMVWAIALLLPLVIVGRLDEYLIDQWNFLTRYRSDLGTSANHAYSLLLGPALVLFATALLSRHAWRTWLPYAMALVTASMAVMASGHLYAHYFHFLYVPASMLMIVALSACDHRHRAVLTLAFVVVTIPSLIKGLDPTERGMMMMSVRDREIVDIDRPRAVARAFARRIEPGTRGYVVCDDPVLYQLLELDPVVRHPFWIHHLRDDQLASASINPQSYIDAAIGEATVAIVGEKCSSDERAVVDRALASLHSVSNIAGSTLYRRKER